jgi:glycosyltransferase involved in cell wall biosynthesis
MDPLKVLWLSNVALSDQTIDGSGSWLNAMARGLLDSNAIELGVIATGPVRQVTRQDWHQVKLWLVPDHAKLGRDGLPSAATVRSIIAAVDEYSPNLVHTWGVEAYWGLLPGRGLLKYPSLLEIQGLKGEIARVFCGGLTQRERFGCIGIKEVLKRRTMDSDRRDLARWGLYEAEIIRGHRFIDVQSSWATAHVSALNPAARLFQTDLALRRPFYDGVPWQPPGRPIVFCTAAYTSPFKALHVAVRALALLKRRIPGARLRIAGAHQRVGVRQDGYMRWIDRMIRQMGLVDAVEWLGPLDAEQIVAELGNAAAVVIPTFIENCCTAMQEAMAVGTPVVVSYVGGIPSLGKDEESCLFFPPGDEAMCAYQLERVLTDKELALSLSRESRRIGIVRNDRQRVVHRQLEIYRQVLEAS